jgi:SAM-dependent methyltransferase
MKKRITLAMTMLALCAIVAGAAVMTQNQRNQTGAVTTTQSMTGANDSVAPIAEVADGPERPLDVPYVPTPEDVVEQMLTLAKVQKDDVVYDLGCGDGRIVITAAKKYGVRGVGVDIDPERIRESKENARKADVQDRVQFLQQDLFKTDVSEASVLMLYLLPEINLRLRPQLFQQLKPGTRIASHSFNMGDWQPDQTVQVPADGYDRTVHFWVLPAHVGGTWQLNGTGAAGQNSLQVNQKFQKSTAH